MNKKKLRKMYKDEVKKAPPILNAKEILARNETMFVDVMATVKKILDAIEKSNDFEFHVAMYNNISNVFKDAALGLAISKVDPKKIGRTNNYVDRMIG